MKLPPYLLVPFTCWALGCASGPSATETDLGIDAALPADFSSMVDATVGPTLEELRQGWPFGTGPGDRALAWYDQRDIPFYYWLYSTFAMSDRFFSAVLGPTWPNRDYLYAATSDGVRNTGERKLDVPTLFDQLDAAGVSWGVY